MTIHKTWDIDLYEFEAWSGGKDTMSDLTWDDCEVIENYLEEQYPDGIDETALNDFLWFERDAIAELLGFDSYDALMFCRNHDGEAVYQFDNAFFTTEDMKKEYQTAVEKAVKEYDEPENREVYSSFAEYLEDCYMFTDFDSFIEQATTPWVGEFTLIQEGE